MKFIKNNSYHMVRLLINQFGMIIFGFMLSFSVGSMKTPSMIYYLLAVSLFSILFYMVLIYTMMWEQGVKDIIRIEAGRMALDRYYGLKLALLANIPNLLLALLVLLGYFWNESLFQGAYILSGILQAPYLGVISFLLESFSLESSDLVKAFVYFLTTLPAILTTSLGYLAGIKNFRFFPKKNTKK